VRLNPPKGPLADDIVYIGIDAPSLFAHPPCTNNMRNGTRLADEVP
jgi:hypothetical protein